MERAHHLSSSNAESHKDRALVHCCLSSTLMIYFGSKETIHRQFFADDTGISVSSRTVPDVQRMLRECISAVQFWMRENKLTLSALTTLFILIASKPRLKKVRKRVA